MRSVSSHLHCCRPHPPGPSSKRHCLKIRLCIIPTSLSLLACICHRKRDYIAYSGHFPPVSCQLRYLYSMNLLFWNYSEIFYFALDWCWNTGKNNLYYKWFSEFPLESVSRPLEGNWNWNVTVQSQLSCWEWCREHPASWLPLLVSAKFSFRHPLPHSLCCVMWKHSFQWVFYLWCQIISFEFSSIWESVLGLWVWHLFGWI